MWTHVTYKKRFTPKWDTFPFGGRNRNPSVALGPITAVYVSEFPDASTAKDLFQLFGCHGNVVEVAISPRRNSLGKRFGFARFVEVSDGRLLAVRLDNIFIGNRKLHVNLPRFERGVQRDTKKIERPFRGFHGDYQDRAVHSRGGISKAAVRRFQSYAEVTGSGQPDLSNRKENNVFMFQSSADFRRRMAKAYVGKVSIPGSARSIQSHFEMEGVFAIKVSPMGSDLCLLEESEVGFIDDLIGVGEEWWKGWFSEIKKWEDGSVDQNRDVWIRVFGVPLHVWCSDFFIALAERWGRFICLDEATAKGDEFAVARIFLNLPIDRIIPDSVVCNIDGLEFKLFVKEDAQGQFRAFSKNTLDTSLASSSSDSAAGWWYDQDGKEDSLPDDSDLFSDKLSEDRNSKGVDEKLCGLESVKNSRELFSPAKNDTRGGNFKQRSGDSMGGFDDALKNVRNSSFESSANLVQPVGISLPLCRLPVSISGREVEPKSRLVEQSVGQVRSGTGKLLCDRQNVTVCEAGSVSVLQPVLAVRTSEISESTQSRVSCSLDRGGANPVKKKVKYKLLNEVGSFSRLGKVGGRKLLESSSAQFCGNAKGIVTVPLASVLEGENCGASSLCYGNQQEESDICRNNDRHWDFLKKDVGDKLLEAIVALGVFDTKGRSNLARRIEELGKGSEVPTVRRKEHNKADQ